jgi:hypothetical protein
MTDGSDYRVRVAAIDDAGNEGMDESDATFTIDNTPPETVIGLDGATSGEWYISDVTVSLDAADAVAGVSSTYYSIDGSFWETYREPFDLTANGIHVVTFYSVDNAGNEEEAKNTTVRVNKNVPSLSITSPLPGHLYIAGRVVFAIPSDAPVIIGKITVQAEATDTVSGISKVEFSVDGVLKFTDEQAPYEWPWDEAVFFSQRMAITAYNNVGTAVTDELRVMIFNI